MAAETTILRAYALACQCKYVEAERLIASDREALNLPHGADLYARILYAEGREDSARRVWKQLLCYVPDYEPATKALAADTESLRFCPTGAIVATRKVMLAIAGIAAFAVGIAFSIGKAWQTSAAIPVRDSAPAVVETAIKEASLNHKALETLRDGFLTNLTDETVLIIGGGSGRYVTDRQKRLSVIAECLKDIAGMPFSKMYFQPASESKDEIVFRIVPDWTCRMGKER